MKKYFFILLTTLTLTAAAQKKADTVTLKNGQAIAGYIYKMDGGKIFIAKQKDSVAYTADEVQTIMFCHDVRSDSRSSGTSLSYYPCCDKSVGTGSGFSKSNSSYSYSANPCDDKREEKGTVLFQCNMCGGKGELKVTGISDGDKVIDECRFTSETGESFFTHTACLVPGEYNWTYTDTNKNSTKGKFIISKGEKKKIILFENK
jgi:hypothetical protein